MLHVLRSVHVCGNLWGSIRFFLYNLCWDSFKKHYVNSFNYNLFDDYQGFQYFSSLPVLHYLQVVLFIKDLNNFHEYLMQHSLKSWGTRDHFRQVKYLVQWYCPLSKDMDYLIIITIKVPLVTICNFKRVL